MHSNQLAAASPRRETLSERLDHLDMQTGVLLSALDDLRNILEPVMVPDTDSKPLQGPTEMKPATSLITVRVDLAASAVQEAIAKLVGIRNRLEI